MAFIYDLTDTWNAGGTTFNAIKMNVTDSASAAASKLITVQVSGSEKFSVTKAGVGYFSENVGIGTSSPAQKLNVIGDIQLSRSTTASDAAINFGSNNNNYIYSGNSSNIMAFQVNASERMRITSSGNIGIGTTSPNGRLHVNSTSTTNAIVSGSDAARLVINGDTINSGDADTEDASLLLLSDGPYDPAVNSGLGNTGFRIGLLNGFAVNALTFTDILAGADRERMRIDSSGNLLVGKTAADDSTAGTRIANVGQISVVRDNQITAIFDRLTSDGVLIRFRRSNANVGDISVTTTATSYNTSSDYRLKNIDGPITGSGAYIDALKPVQGSWKADGSRFIGLLAHEVQEVSETQIATGEKDGEEMQAMDYSAPEIIANLIAEIQSLRARVAQLEGN